MRVNKLCYGVDYSTWARATDSTSNPPCANCNTPCKNGGTCAKGNSSYVCSCTPEFLEFPNCDPAPSSTTTATATPTSGEGCSATFSSPNNWNGGLQAEVSIQCFTGSLNGWQVVVYFPYIVSLGTLSYFFPVAVPFENVTLPIAYL